jgi:hypothetical protein
MLSLVNGFGALWASEKNLMQSGGWTLYMEVLREDGVLASLLGRMKWVYGRILGVVGRSFVATPDLRLEMASRLDF